MFQVKKLIFYECDAHVRFFPRKTYELNALFSKRNPLIVVVVLDTLFSLHNA
jgi:hypothetical protein